MGLFGIESKFFTTGQTYLKMVSEGWQYFELTGKYGVPEDKKNDKTIKNTHKTQFNNFCNEIEKIYKQIGVTDFVRMKSSLKFCVIASGEFDGYVAEARAYEWDIAAGHAIIVGAGGVITDFGGNEILYGKEDFKNPSLILKRSNNL